MNSDKVIFLKDIPVGDGYPVVFMAEIGTFFNQDIELAKHFLEKAASAGAQVFKTEILHNPDVCLKDSGLIHCYKYADGTAVEDYRALIERKVVPLKDYEILFKMCHAFNMPFIASVYDIEGIDFLVDMGAAGIKIARDNIDNVPLMRYAAQTGLPIIIDAGNLYLNELVTAVQTIKATDNDQIIINHHPGANPAPPEIHNLRVINFYKKTFGCPVGLSCHYRGDEILYAAIGCGVNLIEKGIVDDNTKQEQDVVSALNLSELPDVIRRVKKCWDSMGTDTPVVYEPRDLSTRRCISAKRDIRAGEKLTLENVIFSWPPKGISVKYWDIVNGKAVKSDIRQGQYITWEKIDF